MGEVPLILDLAEANLNNWKIATEKDKTPSPSVIYLITFLGKEKMKTLLCPFCEKPHQWKKAKHIIAFYCPDMGIIHWTHYTHEEVATAYKNPTISTEIG